MKIKTRSYSHAVGEFNFHIQLTPAYRRKIFANEKVMKLTKAYLVTKIEELKIELVAMEFGPNHVHIFVANCKNYAPCKLIQYLKGCIVILKYITSITDIFTPILIFCLNFQILTLNNFSDMLILHYNGMMILTLF